MSVSLRGVLETAGFDIRLKEDALWLLSKQREFETLVDEAEELLESLEQEEEEVIDV